MSDNAENFDPQRLAQLLSQHGDANNVSKYLRVAGGQMSDLPVPRGVPEGFLSPQQAYQSGINMTPLMVGANIPIGQGTLQPTAMGANVNAPGFSRTGVNAVGLGYSHPVGGGTLTGTVNKPLQGSGYNAMLQYNKQF